MAAKIFIANRGTETFEFHSYLVYDPDGNAETLDGQLILSGHPFDPIGAGNVGWGGHIVLEIEFDNSNSRDSLDTNRDGINDATVASRDYTALDLSPVLGVTYQTVDDVWEAMVFYALGLAGSSATDPDGRYITEYDYHTLGTNSNSVIATYLSSVGIDFQLNKPQGSITLGFIGSENFLSGAGNDCLYGGNGSDTFMFLKGQNGTDKIGDFDVRDGDKIDISDVLQGAYDPLADMINQFVKIERQGRDAKLSIDADGADNGSHFTTLAIIEGGKDLTLETLLQNGGLIV